MSRNNDTNTLENPATRFFEWSGSDGSISYYDKEAKQKVQVKLPFTFMLLDELTTITGFNESANAGIYSNEIKDMATQKLNVRCGKNTTMALGLYKDIKDSIGNSGGRYTKSCYIAFKDEETKELVIGNIKFSGSSFGGGSYKDEKKNEIKVKAWIDFFADNRKTIYKGAITISKNPQVCVKGATKFYCPSFALKDISPETDAKAGELCTIVEEYHKQYFENAGHQTERSNDAPPETTNTGTDEPTMNGKIPSNAAQTLHAPPTNDVWPPVQEPDSDLPF